MPLTWNDLTVSPYDVDFDDLLSDWRRLVDATYTPVVITALGDLFLRARDGSIWWLDTGWGRLTRVADSADDFKALMVKPEHLNEWSVPQLVGDLKAGGMGLGAAQCHSYKIPPSWAERSTHRTSSRPTCPSTSQSWGRSTARRRTCRRELRSAISRSRTLVDRRRDPVTWLVQMRWVG
jgi:hypothetical protein